MAGLTGGDEGEEGEEEGIQKGVEEGEREGDTEGVDVGDRVGDAGEKEGVEEGEREGEVVATTIEEQDSSTTMEGDKPWTLTRRRVPKKKRVNFIWFEGGLEECARCGEVCVGVHG